MKMNYNLPNDPDIDGAPIWSAQPDEPAKHYAWFHVYLMLGPGRSMRRAYNKFQTEKSALIAESPQDQAVSKSWRDAAALWDWLNRACAFDRNRYIEEELERAQWSAKMAGRAETLMEDLLTRGDELQKLSAQMFNWPLYETSSVNNGQTVIFHPSRWSLDTAVKAVLAQVKAREIALKIFVELDALRARENAREQDAASSALMDRALRALEIVQTDGDASSPTQLRERENVLLNALEASLLSKAQRGVPGAVEKVLRVAQRRSALNGLDKPFDPGDEEKPKKRRDLSAFSPAELDLMEELFCREDEDEESAFSPRA